MNTNSDVIKEIGRLEAEVLSLSVEADTFVNDLLENTPDAWDDDVAGEAIAVRYVRHLEAEVQRLGGCLLPWCRWGDGEYCDHGYVGGTLYRPPHKKDQPCPGCSTDGSNAMGLEGHLPDCIYNGRLPGMLGADLLRRMMRHRCSRCGAFPTWHQRWCRRCTKTVNRVLGWG